MEKGGEGRGGAWRREEREGGEGGGEEGGGGKNTVGTACVVQSRLTFVSWLTATPPAANWRTLATAMRIMYWRREGSGGTGQEGRVRRGGDRRGEDRREETGGVRRGGDRREGHRHTNTRCMSSVRPH